MRRWTTVKIPKELHRQIKKMAQKRNMTQWELIALALSCLEEKKQFGKMDQLDKVSYYIMKLSYSVSMLKANPTKENLEWLFKIADQIQQRLEIDISDLKRIAENYYRRKDKESLILLNMTWKNAIKRLILLLA